MSALPPSLAPAGGGLPATARPCEIALHLIWLIGEFTLKLHSCTPERLHSYWLLPLNFPAVIISAWVRSTLRLGR